MCQSRLAQPSDSREPTTQVLAAPLRLDSVEVVPKDVADPMRRVNGQNGILLDSLPRDVFPACRR